MSRLGTQSNANNSTANLSLANQADWFGVTRKLPLRPTLVPVLMPIPECNFRAEQLSSEEEKEKIDQRLM